MSSLNDHRTLGEALCLAYLKGDMVAAHALADLLHDDAGRAKMTEIASTLRDGGRPSGHEVYHWPEFKAFAKRLGLLYDHLTIDITITIPVDGRIEVTQKYQGVDVQQGESQP